jgi:hypothetical protein
MNKHLPVVLLTLFFTMPCADELIDDFERGESKNLRGGYWYYFSDVKDGGNSEILNAEMLSLGNYSAPRPVKEGSDSGYCLELKYVLGDQMPEVLEEKLGVTEHCSFTGLGTDIARNGGVADISSAYGIRFKAHCRDSIIIIFELVTANIYDYKYYRAYFRVTSEWQIFQVNFNDSEQFNVPDWHGRYDHVPLMLSKVQKMNWHVASCFNNISSNSTIDLHGYSTSDSGSFYLDDIWLLDSSTVNINHTRPRPDNWLHSSVVAGDLMGRRIKNLNILDQISGIYIIKNRKLLKLNTGNIGK